MQPPAPTCINKLSLHSGSCSSNTPDHCFWRYSSWRRGGRGRWSRM